MECTQFEHEVFQLKSDSATLSPEAKPAANETMVSNHLSADTTLITGSPA